MLAQEQASPLLTTTTEGYRIVSGVLQRAERFISVASHRFYDETLADLLIEKRNLGIYVEVVTTPPEAAGTDDLVEWSRRLQKQLAVSGVRVYRCDWELGRPSRTVSTSGGRRYSMHANFLATDNHAVILSTDLTKAFSDRCDMAAYIVYDDWDRIQTLQNKFESLKDFYLNCEAHVLPRCIDSSYRPRKILVGYPYVDADSSLKDDFSLLPFEAYGRPVIEHAISEATDYVYCISDATIDDALLRCLQGKKIRIPGVECKLVTSPQLLRRNRAKRADYVQLSAYGVDVKALNRFRMNLLVTENVVITGSLAFSAMGLGRKRIDSGFPLWFEHTALMHVNTDPAFIAQGKTAFMQLYDAARFLYGDWYSKDARTQLRLAGARRISAEAKETLSTLIYRETRATAQRIKRLAELAVEQGRTRNARKPYIRRGDVVDAYKLLQRKDATPA
jgi:hypothetical protein